MTSDALANLVKIRKLKVEASSLREFDGLVRSALERATDAQNSSLTLASRFTLAYDASHALALAALRAHGYRSEDRYLVFQCLPHTLGWTADQWRILDYCHKKRNLAEYEGHLDVDDPLVMELISVVNMLQQQVPALRTRIV
ncbi:hypothetical protein QN416_23575 [Glaciimonas sp. Cout2]|uniref:hypothetical protein n=1 Tax=Glaciimonas sp. Cout2 TaxID=3048621 RepID=UPI002B239F34|nr:hypothetical protein [Glaciimonas sp. Cout2]MEB0014579.1 hypothetical protein [Glaciimonas sp. Cout2]